MKKSKTKLINYKRNQPKTVPVVKQIAPPAQPVKTQPLPEGIKEALRAKVKLLKFIMSKTSKPVSVSIEVWDSRWALLVHGLDPGFKYFDNYPVFFARSQLASKQ